MNVVSDSVIVIMISCVFFSGFCCCIICIFGLVSVSFYDIVDQFIDRCQVDFMCGVYCYWSGMYFICQYLIVMVSGIDVYQCG